MIKNLNPNILHLSYSATQGGAARAALRIHNGLLKFDKNSTFLCVNSDIDSERVVKISRNSFDFYKYKIRNKLGNIYTNLHHTNNPILHSANFLYSNLHKKINITDFDLVNLHWINHEMISIGDISKITKPIVWTLHDMWAFCGAEHVSYDSKYVNGYIQNHKLFNLDYRVWRKKKLLWQKPFNIVAPSQWMATCAKSSEIMKDWPITVIPNMININFWAPIDQKISREILGLPQDIKIIIFGGANGGLEYHKGGDLLIKILNDLKGSDKEIYTINIGSTKFINNNLIDKYIGSVNNDIILKLLYSASDLLLIPSRVDNFPNMALEAMSCGLPLIAFNIGGLKDICDHKLNGYLARPFEVDDFLLGIKETLYSNNYHNMKILARKKIVENFSEEIIEIKYSNLYKKILK